MKFTGHKTVALSSLRFDIPDIRRRTKQAHVTEMADTIRVSGNQPINDPLVRVGSNDVVCGRDRIAALTILKVKKLSVHLVDCTDSEAAWLERLENAHRRTDNRAQLIAEMVQLRSAAIEQDSKVTSGKGGTVSTLADQTVKAEARKDVARATGIKPASVKKAQQRARQKDSGSNPRGAAPGTPSSARRESEASSPAESPSVPPALADAVGEDDQPLTLDLLGLTDSSARAVMKFARPVQTAIDTADRFVRQALGALKAIEGTAVGQRIRPQVERLGSLIRSERPDSICPYCKGLPKATYEPLAGGPCPTCGGELYVTNEKKGRSAIELRDETRQALVGINGKFIPYEDVRDGKVKPAENGAPAKREKKISVVIADGAGNETPVDLQAEANEAY